MVTKENFYDDFLNEIWRPKLYDLYHIVLKNKVKDGAFSVEEVTK